MRRLNAETVLKGVAVAMGALVVLMAGMELRQALREEAAKVPATADRGSISATLQRCRKLTPEALETDVKCQAAWDAHRRHFFGQPTDDQGAE